MTTPFPSPRLSDTAALRERARHHFDDGAVTDEYQAERIAIESYKEIVDYLGAADPTTRRLFEEVLAVEEAHAEDRHTLIPQIGTTRYVED